MIAMRAKQGTAANDPATEGSIALPPAPVPAGALAGGREGVSGDDPFSSRRRFASTAAPGRADRQITKVIKGKERARRRLNVLVGGAAFRPGRTVFVPRNARK
jgi:hypothetical protein